MNRRTWILFTVLALLLTGCSHRMEITERGVLDSTTKAVESYEQRPCESESENSVFQEVKEDLTLASATDTERSSGEQSSAEAIVPAEEAEMNPETSEEAPIPLPEEPKPVSPVSQQEEVEPEPEKEPPEEEPPQETDPPGEPVQEPEEIPVEPETESKPEQPHEPETEPETEQETPAFDIGYWISYAKSLAEEKGLRLDSSAVDCWDNPITANADCIYLERDLSARLSRYAGDEEITDVWIWYEDLGNQRYLIYIGYA